MELVDKIDIIVDYFQSDDQDEEYFEFISNNDIGVPLAVSFSFDLIELKEGGVKAIEETWVNLCKLYGSDPEAEYATLEDLG